MEHLWWVVVRNEMQGPLALADVLALLEDDRSEEARIWREGYTEWRVPENVPEVTVRQILRELCVFLSVRDNGERSSNFS